MCVFVSRDSEQKRVTLPTTTKAGYTGALADVIEEVLLFRRVWRFMLPGVVMPDVVTPCIPAFEDDQGAVQLAQNPTLILQFQARLRGTG